MKNTCSYDLKMFVCDGASSLTPQNARAWVPKCETKKILYKRSSAETCMLNVPQENPGGVQKVVVATQLGSAGFGQFFLGDKGIQINASNYLEHFDNNFVCTRIVAVLRQGSRGLPRQIAEPRGKESLLHCERRYPTERIQEYPPCSPDLNPLDFSIWPRVTSKMLDMPPARTNVQMRANVLAAADLRR